MYYIFRKIENGCYNKYTEQKIDQKGSLIEDTDQGWIISFSADLVRQSDIEAADEEVAECNREDGGHSHAYCIQ